MPLPPDRLAALAEELLTARAERRQIPPVQGREPGFDMAAAHKVAARIRTLRVAMGETPVGRKIGFTNRTLWDRYGVHAPIWGDMFDSTVRQLGDGPATVVLPALTEPRIEPEIVLGLATDPEPGMAVADLAGCVDWVAHGFEVVTSVYPGWQFAAADTQAAFGLHGTLLVGPRTSAATLGPDPAAALSGLTVTLTGPGTRLEGRGTDVLDGPIHALRHLVEALDRVPGADPLAAGDIVTTGTLTDAMPLAPGSRWQTDLTGVPLANLDVTFSA